MVPGTLKTSINRIKFWVIIIKIIVENLPGERIHMRKISRISLEEQERQGENTILKEGTGSAQSLYLLSTYYVPDTIQEVSKPGNLSHIRARPASYLFL